jgi:hypothetical protein
LCFIVFALLLCLAMCFAFAPCCCVVVPCYLLLHFATLPCYLLSHLVALPCCSSRLAIHHCTFPFTFAPSCSLSHLTTCLCALLFTFFFFKYLLPPSHCCFATLLFAFAPCCYAFSCQLTFLPYSLVQMEELGKTTTNFIQ